MHKNKDFGFLIYIFIIFILTQNGSSTLPLKKSSAGQLLTGPAGNSSSTAWLSPPAPALTTLFSIFKKASAESRQVKGLKNKRRSFCFPLFYIPVNVLWIQIPVQILLHLCCQRLVSGWGRRQGRGWQLLDFLSLTAKQLFPRNGSLHFFQSPTSTCYAWTCPWGPLD